MDSKQPAGLPGNAYTPLKKGEKYQPIIPASQIIPEVTVRSVLWGVIMAIIFSFGAAYLGLKIGQVFEAAIPIAILAIGVSRIYKRKNTLSENVIIQSIGAASGVVVAGGIFVIPAFYILQIQDQISLFHTFLAAFIGGSIGILFLIPMRRFLRLFCRCHAYLEFSFDLRVPRSGQWRGGVEIAAFRLLRCYAGRKIPAGLEDGCSGSYFRTGLHCRTQIRGHYRSGFIVVISGIGPGGFLFRTASGYRAGSGH
jgi:hypothetical protein